MHTSIKLDSPCEFINVVPINPLISKCEIKVCYVGDEPNRNHSIITKEVAREMANSLPGSPIVGFFNEATDDFEEHNCIIDISNGRFEIKDTTKPYGFVDLNAKCWFQKFLDDGVNEHEYLMTTGYLWTGQYPECRRIIEQGNNQSMELDETTLDATWSKSDNNEPSFFIINEAIISKLCILGEQCEPCFEGATITKPSINFSFDEDFKQQLFSMMTELQKYLSEGGANKVLTAYTAIGDMRDSLYNYLSNNYCSDVYQIEGIYEDTEDEHGQKFVVLKDRNSEKYYRLYFSTSGDNEFTFAEQMVECTDYAPAADFQALSDNAAEGSETEFKKKKNVGKTGKGCQTKNQDNTDSTSSDDEEDEESEDEEDESDDSDETDDEPEDKKKKKKKYNEDKEDEYVALKQQYASLQTNYNALLEEQRNLNQQIKELTEFKAQIERKDKQTMIDSFYMLSDEDKADVVKNIDTYSLDDIEAKLSIICVRNRVSFDRVKDASQSVTTFNLNNTCDDLTPDWIKSALETAKTMN